MNKLVSVPTGLRDVKTILDDLDVSSLKTALIDLQKLIRSTPSSNYGILFGWCK